MPECTVLQSGTCLSIKACVNKNYKVEMEVKGRKCERAQLVGGT